MTKRGLFSSNRPKYVSRIRIYPMLLRNHNAEMSIRHGQKEHRRSQLFFCGLMYAKPDDEHASNNLMIPAMLKPQPSASTCEDNISSQWAVDIEPATLRNITTFQRFNIALPLFK